MYIDTHTHALFFYKLTNIIFLIKFIIQIFLYFQESQNKKSQKNNQITQNTLNSCSGEHFHVDTLVMKLLKSSLEKENDEHDIFGAYVAMEMRNLKTSDAQIQLRTEIRDAISRIVREESMTINKNMCYSNSKETDNNLTKTHNFSKSSQNVSSGNDANVDPTTHIKKTRKLSWELIN